MNKRSINPREKVLFQITCGVIVAVILYSIIITPQQQQRKDIQQRQAELEADLQKLQADFQVKDQIDLAYARVEPMLNNGQTDQQEISHFTRQLHELYGPLRLTIKSVKILPLTRETHTRKLAIKIELKGKVSQMITFITRLTGCSGPIKIEQFQLQAMDVAELLHGTFKISKIVGPKG